MIRVNGKKLKGNISAIPSKSYAHRALIAAALSKGESNIFFHESSDDIDYTISSLRSLGSDIEYIGKGVKVGPIRRKKKAPIVDVGESATTFRILLPVASSIYRECKFIGGEALAKRPIIGLLKAMNIRGVNFTSNRLPLTSKGRLNSGVFKIPGDISSQYISGLLFASSLLEGRSQITLSSKLESKPYVDITIDVLKKFGIEVETTAAGYLMENQEYRSIDYNIEGDWSNGSFFLVAGALGQGITMTGLNLQSIQGDRKIMKVLEDYGAQISIGGTSISIVKGKKRAINVDLMEIPDSLPILAIIAASANGGISRFYNGKRLRYKESDRLSSVATMIRDLGGRVEEREEELLIYGTGGLKGGFTSSFGDHRLVMAASIASIISKEDVLIKNPQVVSKSYPGFFKDFQKLGGEVIVQ